MMFDAQRDRIRREARVAGIARHTDPSLEAVASRRLQLWGLMGAVLLSMSAAVVLSSFEGIPRLDALPPALIRGSVIALAVAFAAYTIEKEVHLNRLTALLVEEQARGDALGSEVERLLELDRVRAETIVSVRRDLRTPLDAVLSSAGLLRGARSDPERAVLIDAIERQGGKLGAMLDELVSTADLEREGPPLELEPVNLPRLVHGVAADLALTGRPTEVMSPVVEQVRASAEGLRRVVTNLIDNAHTHGRMPVRVLVERAGAEVVVSVRDSGEGIPPADRRRVFELFTRLDHGAGPQGLGLGLAVVPGLVATWGGRVWVDEAPEGGAAFHVALPSAERWEHHEAG